MIPLVTVSWLINLLIDWSFLAMDKATNNTDTTTDLLSNRFGEHSYKKSHQLEVLVTFKMIPV